MIILTATESSLLFAWTQTSNNLEQFSCLHLSLQIYPNNWEDVSVGRGRRLEGKYPGWASPVATGTTRSLTVQTDFLKAGPHFHEWVAVQDLGADDNPLMGQPGPLLDSSTC